MTEPSSTRALDEAGRLLSRRVGLRLDPAIRGRLARAVRREAEGCGADDAEYVARLDADPDLLQSLLNRVTVQESSFFRDPGQFVALATHVLPVLGAEGRPVCVWSAGCANGQEPYSVAMSLAESGIADWRVIASDISTDALARTRSATYRERELRGLSAARRERFLTPVDGGWQVVPELRERVTVIHHNLAADPPPFELGGCQVVLCRNVLIYFQLPDVIAFLDRLATRLPATGHLFLGYSESLWQVSDRFELIRLGEAFAYRRSTAAGASSAAARRVRRPSASRPARTVRPPRDPAPHSAPRPSPPIPRTTVELMAAGEEALGRGDHGAAIAAFRKAVFLDPDQPIAHLNLGLAFESAGADAAARRAYTAARAALRRGDTAAVEIALEGYHLDDLMGLLDQKVAKS